MPTFKYEAMDTTGGEVKDVIKAANEEEAQQKIRQLGYFVTKLVEVAEKARKDQKGKKGAAKGGKTKTFTIGGVSTKQLVTFTRQFSTLQDAGLPVLRSLKILEGQMRPGALKNSLIDVVDDIESGQTLSESMAKHPKAFDRLYVNMVRAGEAGGALEVILRRLAEFKEKAQSLQRRVKGAMVYPVAVITVAVVILSFILIFIIPKFEKIFQDFKLKLPAITEFLMASSKWFTKNWYVVPMIPVFIWLFFKLIRLNKTGAYILDKIKLKLPVAGTISEKAIVARTTRTLGTLIASGVPILEALSIVRARTCMNMVFEEMFLRVYLSRFGEGETILAADAAEEPARRGHGGQHDRRRRGDRRPRLDAREDRRRLRRGSRRRGRVAHQPARADHGRGPRPDRRHDRDRAVHAAREPDRRTQRLQQEVTAGTPQAAAISATWTLRGFDMADTERNRTGRAGFTTIELLVVIAIIAILLALLAGGVLRSYAASFHAQTEADLVNLAQGLENFKTRFGAYPPSTLNKNNVAVVMRKFWPSISLTSRIRPARALNISLDKLDLQGDQCLVLFVGGRHVMKGGATVENPTGFSENPTNPFETGGNRIGPYFKFNNARLYQRDLTLPIASCGDGWFASGVKAAQTNPPCYAYFSTSFVTASNNGNGVGYYSDTDCSRMIDAKGTFPRPFVNLSKSRPGNPVKFEYVNPSSFQIISPGSDTIFGAAFKFPAKERPD